jgi:hypothetical protein
MLKPFKKLGGFFVLNRFMFGLFMS